MVLTILVSGLLEYDSGKTWLSIGIGLVAKRSGARIGLYKPVAGHSFWNKFSSVLESRRRRVLLGNDVLLYEKYLGISDRLEIVNPVDLLVAYPDPLLLHGPSEYLVSISSLDKSLVLARVTDCRDGLNVTHLVFRENLDYTPAHARNELVSLSRVLGAREYNVKHFLGFLMSREASELLDECRKTVSEDKDVVIIESFSNSLLPYAGVAEAVDLVMVVAPGKAVVFTGDKLRQALEVLGDRAVRSDSLLSIGRYSASLVADIPPASSPRELADKLEESELKQLIM